MDFIKGELNVYCYMVQRGKPAACLPLQERYVDEGKSFVASKGLHTYIQQLSEGWVTLWIYKHQHIHEVINHMPQVPDSVIDHWMLGKLFGYDENSISEFLSQKFI
jgi:hypothetical protein